MQCEDLFRPQLIKTVSSGNQLNPPLNRAGAAYSVNSCTGLALSFVWVVNHGNALPKRQDLVGEVLPEWGMLPRKQQVAKSFGWQAVAAEARRRNQHRRLWRPDSERVRFEELAQDLLNEYQANNRKSSIWVRRRINLHLMPFFRGFRGVDVTVGSGHLSPRLPALYSLRRLKIWLLLQRFVLIPKTSVSRACLVCFLKTSGQDLGWT